MYKSILGALALATAGIASASIIPSLTGDPTDNGNGSFTYIYEATLASDQALFDGSYFTLYDFGGFLGFGDVPEFWTPSAQLVGVTPGNVVPNDDPTILNLTFTYSGPVVNYDEPGMEMELGLFEVFSSIGVFRLDDFTSEAVKNSGEGRGSLVSSIGMEAVAVPGDNGAVVPEPAVWGLMIAGFGMVGGAMRRRKTTVVSA